MNQYKIAVAGTGYVGLRIATLLAQHNQVTAVDGFPKGRLNQWLQVSYSDEYIEKYSTDETTINATLTDSIVLKR